MLYEYFWIRIKLFISKVGIIELDGIWNGLKINEWKMVIVVIIGKIDLVVLVIFGLGVINVVVFLFKLLFVVFWVRVICCWCFGVNIKWLIN